MLRIYASAWRRDNVSYLSLRPSVRYQTCEHDVLTNQPISMHIGKSSPLRKGMKRLTLGSGCQEVKGQDQRHRRWKLDLEAWRMQDTIRYCVFNV